MSVLFLVAGAAMIAHVAAMARSRQRADAARLRIAVPVRAAQAPRPSQPASDAVHNDMHGAVAPSKER